MCLVPDGDLFRAISRGEAEVVTDRIAGFTEGDIALESGRELPADVVVTATGLRLRAMGGMELTVDGAPVRLPETLSYKGAMVSGVPNLAMVIGYTNNSWTLKADLVNRFTGRVLRHMRERGYDTVTPVPAADERTDRPFLDLTSGYVQRGVADLPRQGTRPPWRLDQNYLRDLALFRCGPLEDGALRFTRRAGVRPGEPVAPSAAGTVA